MVSPAFVDIPADLFVEIVKYVDVKDVHSMLATCSTIRKHAESRFLWISVLTETRSRRPLPRPSFQNLSNVDLDQLKRMARQVYALEKNWNRQEPKVVGAVRVISCPIDSRIVALIPGANLIVLHGTWDGKPSLICLDTNSAKSLDTIPVGSHLVEVSHPYEEQGTFMIAVTTGGRPNKPKDIYAIRIEYGNNKATTMRQVFHHQVLPQKISHVGLFLDAEILGYVARETSNRADSFLMAINMTTNIYVRCNIQTPIRSLLACYMYGGHVYILTEGIRHWNVKLWNRESLPYTSLANKEITFPQVESNDITITVDDHKPLALFSCVPAYGIHAISHRHNAIQFWSASPTRDINYPLSFPTSSLLSRFDSAITCPGGGPPCLWAGSSGNYVLALFDVDDDEHEHELRLIHYDHVNDPCSRVLTLPQFLSYQLSAIRSIALDDHLGKAYLGTTGGAICELSYV